MVQAIVFWKKAAGLGNARAQRALGHCYAVGDGVKVNLAESALWTQKAAEQGEVEARTALGICYSEGKGVVKDTAKAVSWWKKAAEQGCIVSQVKSDRNSGIAWRCYEKVGEEILKNV